MTVDDHAPQPQCSSCGCYQPDGLLCSDDSAAYLTMLAAVPGLVHELNIAASKQAKISAGSKSGKGTARERNPVNWNAVAARDALLFEAALWGDDIDAVRRHPQAAEILSSLGRVVANAYRAIDRAVERKYLGVCLYSEDGATCHGELWAAVGADSVKCSQCETVWSVVERRKMLLKEASPMVVTAKQAAHFIAEWGGRSVSETNIRNWVGRGKIQLRPGLSRQRQFELGALLRYIESRSCDSPSREVAQMVVAV